MAMLGKVEDLIAQVRPQSRLERGLALIQDYLAGRAPEIAKIVASQKPGDSTKLVIEGGALYVIIQCYHARTRAEARFEAHERHTDLQYICAGQEWIEVCDLRAQRHLPRYDTDGNIFFPLEAGDHSRLLLQSGVLAVLFPNDAHAPCLRVDGSGDDLVRKIVVKVEDALVTDGFQAFPALLSSNDQPSMPVWSQSHATDLSHR